MNTNLNARFLSLKIADDIIWNEKEELVYICKMDEDSDGVFSIDGMAVDFWKLLTEGKNVETAYKEFLEASEAGPDEFVEEVNALLGELESLKFIL